MNCKLTPGGVSLFYYASHGIQVRDANYLIPTAFRATMTGRINGNVLSAGGIGEDGGFSVTVTRQ